MKALSYKDICLVPKFSYLESRSQANISVELGNHIFSSPIIPANMVSCIDIQKAKWFSENNYFYVMHRFLTNGTEGILDFCKVAKEENWKTISISIGVKKEDFRLVSKLASISARVDYITIDIAHGHSFLMKNMIKHINSLSWKEKPFIIAGNVTTPLAVHELTEWGADAIKVGIGGGGACSTKNKTGFHVPMFTATLICCSRANIPIVADGGIRENGDIAKAIVAGATMVMAGSLFAACVDSPAENIYGTNTGEKGRVIYKRYFGSASVRNKGYSKHIEGFEVDLPCNGYTYEEKMQRIEEDLQSAISYSGGKDLASLKETSYFEIAKA